MALEAEKSHDTQLDKLEAQETDHIVPISRSGSEGRR